LPLADTDFDALLVDAGQRMPVSQLMSARVDAPAPTVTATVGQRGNVMPVDTVNVYDPAVRLRL
jgi:hypothetical protein